VVVCIYSSHCNPQHKLNIEFLIGSGGSKYQLVFADIARKKGFGQWGSLVGHMGFITDNNDLIAPTLLAEADNKLHCRMAGADNDDLGGTGH
jgi:hypothetical protein